MEELETIDESSLDRFMARWYGVRRSGEDADDLRTPPPLARWYELASAGGQHVTQYYQVRSPNTLEVVDGLLVFCDDAAGEFVWACERGAADPATFERTNDESQWRDTGFRLSSLLLYVAVAGAVMNPAIGMVNTTISSGDFELAIGHFRKLENPLWSWPDPNLSYYAGDRVLAYGGSSGDPAGWQLLVGAQDTEALSVLDGIEWEWDSRTVR